jgi:hypothetical protein
MDGAKIQFSPAEMELMNNADLILTKNKVLYKIKAALETLQEELLECVYKNSDIFSQPHFETTPKISKGENYLGLPYIVLDYPREFDSQNIFAIRTMFWWGHFFSVTLQLAGSYKEEITPHIEDSYEELAKHQFYININEDPWQHHFENDNYILIQSIDKETFHDYCQQYEHLKIAAQFPLWDANFITDDLLESWKILAEISAG